MAPTVMEEGMLGRLVAKIFETVQPRRIILFGSPARGQMGAHSDVDLLVVMLTSYAFEARYPGPGEPVAEEEYKHALDLAKIVVRWAESVLEQHPA